MTVISAEDEGIRSSKTALPGVLGHSKPSQVLCNSCSTSWPCVVSHLTLLSSTCVWFPTFLVGSMRWTCSECCRSLSISAKNSAQCEVSGTILILPCDPNERFLSFLVEPVLLN